MNSGPWFWTRGFRRAPHHEGCQAGRFSMKACRLHSPTSLLS
jgi:hypothetical protein